MARKQKRYYRQEAADWRTMARKLSIEVHYLIEYLKRRKLGGAVRVERGRAALGKYDALCERMEDGDEDKLPPMTLDEWITDDLAELRLGLISEDAYLRVKYALRMLDAARAMRDELASMLSQVAATHGLASAPMIQKLLARHAEQKKAEDGE